MNLEQAKKAFAEYDYDNDGFITLQGKSFLLIFFHKDPPLNAVVC